MRSYCAASAGAMACRLALGSGAGAALGCEEQADRETPNHPTTACISRGLRITGVELPHHRGHITLRRPDQRDDPSNHAPPQEKVQQEDGQRVPPAARQRNNRRQEIHEGSKTKAKERKKEGQVHRVTSLALITG